MHVRPETEQDRDHVRRLVESAFGREDEADLVERLRAEGDAAIALVAELDGETAGHLVLSPMREPAAALGLGPISVRPDLQRRGVGAALIREALKRARHDGWRAVFVLGDPPWYTRFGFEPELARGYATSFEGPFLMALELAPGALTGEGELRYARAFDDLAE